MSSRTEPGWAVHVAGLAALIGVATVLRFIGLGSGLWYDEIVTLVESARLPFVQIVTVFPGVNAHPFYSVLAHASLAAFGESAWALRLPACLFGVASVWMAYVLGARLIGRVEAWAGAFLLAVSYHHIWFSQNARGYTMMGFFALLSTFLLLRAAERGAARDYVFYALACAAGVYTHLTMAFVVAGQAAVLVGGWAAGWRPAQAFRPQSVLLAWTGAAAVGAILYLPYFPGLIRHFGAEAPVAAARVATGGWAIAEALRSVLFGAGVPAAILGGVVAVAGAVSLWRRDPLAVALLIMPAVVSALSIAALGQPMRPRFFFFMAGAAAIFAGRGLGAAAPAIESRMAALAAAIPGGGVVAGALLLAALSAIALPRNYTVPKQDFEHALIFLEGEEATGARIAAAGPACYPFEVYYRKWWWPCLESTADLRSVTDRPGRGLVVHTLADYIADPDLGRRLRAECAEVRRFPGTLGGGDLIVCDPRGREAR